MYKSQRKFSFFMPDGKSGRKFGKWPYAGFYPNENTNVKIVEIFGKSHPASSPIFEGPGFPHLPNHCGQGIYILKKCPEN